MCNALLKDSPGTSLRCDAPPAYTWDGEFMVCIFWDHVQARCNNSSAGWTRSSHLHSDRRPAKRQVGHLELFLDGHWRFTSAQLNIPCWDVYHSTVCCSLAFV